MELGNKFQKKNKVVLNNKYGEEAAEKNLHEMSYRKKWKIKIRNYTLVNLPSRPYLFMN